MPSLFRRNNTAEPEPVDEIVEPAEQPALRRSKSYTPSKKELGRVTPKRAEAQRRRGAAEPPPANRREAAKRLRERQRAERAERMAGMQAGDDRFLPARDRGPERALVRDVVDSRRTAGTWFFGGALVVLLGSSQAMPPQVRLAANLLWVALAVAVVVDSVLICRKIKQLVHKRFPDTGQRMRSLYTYAIMRSVTMRRIRLPKPRVRLGEKI